MSSAQKLRECVSVVASHSTATKIAVTIAISAASLFVIVWPPAHGRHSFQDEQEIPKENCPSTRVRLQRPVSRAVHRSSMAPGNRLGFHMYDSGPIRRIELRY